MPQKSRRRDAPVLAGRARSYRSGPDPARQHRCAVNPQATAVPVGAGSACDRGCAGGYLKTAPRDAWQVAGRARSYRSGPDPARQHRYAARASSNRSPCRSRLCLRPWLRRWILKTAPRDAWQVAGTARSYGGAAHPVTQHRYAVVPHATAVPVGAGSACDRGRAAGCPKARRQALHCTQCPAYRPVRPGPMRWLSQPQALRHDPKARPTASCCTNFAPRA